MDLLSSIRKEGSRGGVDFKWSDVTTSSHRENYLGHSLMAPVGRWQKGRDLSWYAKGDDGDGIPGETAEEKKVRERKEEIRRIKEAEEDALARALGLPVADRTNGQGSGANAVDVGEMKRVIREAEEGDDGLDAVGKVAAFGDFVGKVADGERFEGDEEQVPAVGGLVRRGSSGKTERRNDRSQSRERTSRRRHRHERSRDRERHRHRDRDERHGERRRRSRSPERRERRHRSRSIEPRPRKHRSRSGERFRDRREDREHRRSREQRPRRSPSPGIREDRRNDRRDDRYGDRRDDRRR
ncbi:MAG: hypothetical protein M1818_005906 [Claussenomyces sp. TS43310]|nr:MAG: hypothetical protein M1818_005906 [Claussenomyces sp. TS43310]